MATQIAALNFGLKGKQIIPATDENGVSFLNADLLTDCDNGQTWKEFRAIFPKAEIYEVAAAGVPDKSVKVAAKTIVSEASKLRVRFADVLADVVVGDVVTKA